MIKSYIQDIAIKRGIENANQLKDALECSPTVAARLWRGDFKKLGMDTLDRLCDLLSCDVGALLRHEAGQPKKKASKQKCEKTS